MKVLSVVGARPQFIKAAPVSRALRSSCTEYLLHTGQHYDDNLSKIFFEELGIPEPDENLGVGSGAHGRQTGEMLIGIEAALLRVTPDCVLVYGDTNSTLAGALAACKLHVPVAHVEAGLRSFNRTMPEEHNRVLADHVSDFLFCPTEASVANLYREGMEKGVHLVGDVMYDAVLQYGERASERSSILHDLALKPGGYFLATVHRPGNTDEPAHLAEIFAALAALEKPVVFPVHPRTRERIAAYRAQDSSFPDPKALGVRMIDPVGYLDMLSLERHARAILTDSGGMQKEAYFLSVPCLTLREETEWVETVQSGWNTLVGHDRAAIIKAARQEPPSDVPRGGYGNGDAAVRIVGILKDAWAS
ncbi:MAG: UDP-N-acetylglucosamine 2-epimerase (non-hydrolyzing) [Planctomycetota bacterium]